ncbi:hypothetical protein [Streptomyces sp. ITFR-16]|uniref:hypothetical protein n=1 Tax=Streptomyces sp. ITFR-16 TaxID=3075198 RepID=UPI0028896AB3|nr:hypothetical protein [Streptomyces sp. ITFR-16]WNI20414.1 hypothetical protein RLT58_00055 [Streptomyces sp. ITFR-16]
MARGTWSVRGLWAAAGALGAVVVLTLYVLLSGGGDEGSGKDAAPDGGGKPSRAASASPSPSYTVPDDWSEPQRWAALPRARTTDRYGSQVGFPHTPDGAAAMAVASNSVTIEGDTSGVDEQTRIYHSYVGSGDQSPGAAERVEQAAEKADKKLAEEMGVAPGQALPSGAYMRSHVIGFKVVEGSADEMAMWVLARTTTKRGETAKETGAYSRTLVGLQWQDGDWKITGDATKWAMQRAEGKTEPKIVAVGDEEFNTSGWTAIREAS